MNEDAARGAAAPTASERFRCAFEDAPIGMAIVDLDGACRASTPRSARHRALRRRSSSARRIDALAGRRARTATAPGPTGAGVEIERRFVRADGRIGWGLWQHSLVHDRDDAPAYWVMPLPRHLQAQGRRAPARLPGPPRLAHGPAEPRAASSQRLREAIADPATRAPGRRAVRRPRQLQGRQRLARPRGRRPPARGRRRAAARRAAPGRRRSPASAATSSPSWSRATSASSPPRRVADRLARRAARRRSCSTAAQRFVTASVGIALGRPGDADAEALLRDADAAMYRAKEPGKARCEVFDDSMRDARARAPASSRAACAARSSAASCSCVYQPQVDLTDGRDRRRRGADALAPPRRAA